MLHTTDIPGALALDGQMTAVEDLDLSKFFNTNECDLFAADLGLNASVSSASHPLRSASVPEVPGTSHPTSPTPTFPTLLSTGSSTGLVPGSPPAANNFASSASTPLSHPFAMPNVPSSATPGMITPETIAAMNMHTLSLGLALPAFNPLQLFNPAPFGMNPLELAAAAAAFAGATPSIVPPTLLPSAANVNPQHALSASLLRDGLVGAASMSSPSLPLIGAGGASASAPTPPSTPAYLSPVSPPSTGSIKNASVSLPPKAPTFARTVSTDSTPSPSPPASGLSSASTSSPGSPEPLAHPKTESSLPGNGTVTPGGSAKPKKKRRPKPRMCELTETQAQAKRDANRESARKCRERKRVKETVVQTEKQKLVEDNDKLRAALAAERAKTEALERILLEKEAYISGLHKRLRLDTSATIA